MCGWILYFAYSIAVHNEEISLQYCNSEAESGQSSNHQPRDSVYDFNLLTLSRRITQYCVLEGPTMYILETCFFLTDSGVRIMKKMLLVPSSELPALKVHLMDCVNYAYYYRKVFYVSICISMYIRYIIHIYNYN